MRFFFRSKKFKVILAVSLTFVILAVTFALIGGRIAPQADFAGMIMAPFRSGFTKISNAVDNAVTAIKDGDAALIENADLETEISELRNQLVEYEKMKTENEFYKNYLEIKDDHEDFVFAPATVISKDSLDPFKSFTVNAGSVNGVKLHDPVITEAGLVGYVSEVGTTTCKIVTVLDPDISLGALDIRTSDSGVLYGSLTTAREGMTGLYNLSRTCSVTVGDYIVTSGEGIFPEGLLIGTVRTIATEKYNTSIYATIEPFVNLDEIKNVMIITEFEGRGGLEPGK